MTTNAHGGARKGAGRPPKVRAATKPAEGGTASAEEYLARVIAGTEPADPVRVRAATALIRYQRAVERAPVQSPAPAQLAQRVRRDAEVAVADEFERKAEQIRRKHAKKGTS